MGAHTNLYLFLATGSETSNNIKLTLYKYNLGNQFGQVGHGMVSFRISKAKSCLIFGHSEHSKAIEKRSKSIITNKEFSVRVVSFVFQPKQIQEIKDFLLTARRKDAKCE